ncbi:MAG: hypothetical protein FWH20_05175 [Oscillospiraceae bacterium]|nr:hypothetical protein [Oscillospiraceae bacterium]
MNVHEDTLQGLREIRDYVRGDKARARSVAVEVPDEEIEFIRVYRNLSKDNKHKTKAFVDDLLRVSNQ